MNALQSIIYGCVYGFTEFLPVSSQGHMAVFNKVFGINSPEPFRLFLVHISLLLAVVVSFGAYIQRLRRGNRSGTRFSRKSIADKSVAFDLRLIKTAAVPMLIVLLLRLFTTSLYSNLALTALFFLINGIVVYVPEHLPQSNKDASRLSAFDSFVMGIFAGLSAFPGISRVGTSLSYAIARGADKQKALYWIYVLSIPAIVLLLIFDVIQMVSVGLAISSFAYFCNCILTALASFGAGVLGIYFMQFIAVRSGFSVFGYYCWGAALLSFILYLMV